ncbi:hypothetical protein [Chryseobacterium jejuense]|uniref:Uncharacterized protein n=1 Tax=Chryseobacterium jejuense TaxID=445960 RepID=A0A2X2VJ94_CHRJE|nr:hypothetical protein [Chryseobacterium jejuense]SDJ20341.1 hypothetical protein SAMN05421542_3004 [Chryseobacterium jejuense]SQB28484.1 Uncharacterised protein [Chryseobacterium jejuense]
MSTDTLRTMVFNREGFILNIPILDEIHFFAWDSIDTILYGAEILYHDHSEFIMYLNQPPIIKLKENAWWLNRLTFWIKNRKNKKIRISDEWNKDFSDFIGNAKKYLPHVQDIDLDNDKRKGTLINRTKVEKNNRSVIIEKWKPERTTSLQWKMVYDRYSRSVEDIYNRDKGI